MKIWILGATGRIGRLVAADLARRGVEAVLVGRDRKTLEEMAGTARVVVVDGLTQVAAALGAEPPVVVVNLLGPFAQSADVLLRASPPGSHYLDLANDAASVKALLDRNDVAVAERRCLVTGAGFGVLGCESMALKLVGGRSIPASVRIDAVPLIDAPGPMGSVVAATVVDSLGGAVGNESELVQLPDGTSARTNSAPSGDAIAVERATGARHVVVASSMVPSGRLVRLVTPLLAWLATVGFFRRVLVRQFAKLPGSPARRTLNHTWVRGQATWSDGTRRETWLRAGEGMIYTARVASEVAVRLASDEGRPGAHTPGALFGADLAVTAGGTFLGED